jgi:hypothetical protein
MAPFEHTAPEMAIAVFVIAVAGVALLLTLVLRYGLRIRRSAPLQIKADSAASLLPIRAAAERAYEEAKNKDMVIAFVAEREGGDAGPVEWMEKSIARVVPVYKRDDASDFYTQVSVRHVEDGLYVRDKDLRRYLRWAKGMQ